jgi:signal transduction histidine kinase
MRDAGAIYTTETVEDRIVAVMRLVLAASALIITFVDPAEPSRLVALTYTALSLYTLYSALLYVFTLWLPARIVKVHTWAHWLDVAWYILLISLSNGTSSIFFFGFFFAILVASFRWGFAAGFRVTIISTVLFTVVGLATAPRGIEFELNRSLVRPIYLLTLGYMMAYWGGYEIALKRRMQLLRDVSTLSNPRFGIDRTIGTLLERLRTYYDADTALLVSSTPNGEYQMRRVDQHDPDGAIRAVPIPSELATQLFALAEDQALIYQCRSRPWQLRRVDYAVNIVTGERTNDAIEVGENLAATLESEAFISLPLRFGSEPLGRLYLTSTKTSFDPLDIELLLQVFKSVTPVIDNIRLVDRLASEAADEERQRIARDLHDSVIQPYIGLQMGLAAVKNKHAGGSVAVADDLERLFRLANDGIADLRGYVSGLKQGGDRSDSLQASIKRFTSKFAQATGINVDFKAKGDFRCNDRLGAEVFQMVAEGLSNIRRHTQAANASVELIRDQGCLLLRVTNEGICVPAKSFTPRSISERAASLGGQAQVEQLPDNSTAVVVQIPL